MTTRSLSVEEASEDAQAPDVAKADPVGCAIPNKTVEKQRSLDAGDERCLTMVSHKGGVRHELKRSHHTVIPIVSRRTSVYHIPGLWRRNGVFQYRVRVPIDVVATLGTTHLSRSLMTTDWRAARRAVHETALLFQDRFALARGETVRDDRRAPQTSPTICASTRSAPPLTLSRAWALYLDDPTSKRSTKSRAAYGTVQRLVEAILGPTTSLDSLTRQQCREVLEVLQGLPSNYEKRLPGLSPTEAVAVARDTGMTPMTASNLNSYMEKFSGLLNWCVKEELMARNPCRGLRVVDPVSARNKRYPFSDAQLDRIFGHPLFDLSQGIDQFSDTLEVARRFIPLIGLFSGMRQNEICQLLVEDVVETRGITCFLVRSDEQAGKRLKTASSQRLVPLHPALIKAGLLEYHSDRMADGDARLWPRLDLDRFGYASCYFSKWFARSLLACGAKEPRTCFHSLRHNFRDALRNAGVDREIAHALGGWSNPSGGVSVGDAYGQGHRLSTLLTAISAVKYEDVKALKWLTSQT